MNKWSKQEIRCLQEIVESCNNKNRLTWKSVSRKLNQHFENNRSSTACRLKYRKTKVLKKHVSSKRSNKNDPKIAEIKALRDKISRLNLELETLDKCNLSDYKKFSLIITILIIIIVLLISI